MLGRQTRPAFLQRPEPLGVFFLRVRRGGGRDYNRGATAPGFAGHGRDCRMRFHSGTRRAGAH